MQWEDGRCFSMVVRRRPCQKNHSTPEAVFHPKGDKERVRAMCILLNIKSKWFLVLEIFRLSFKLDHTGPEFLLNGVPGRGSSHSSPRSSSRPAPRPLCRTLLISRSAYHRFPVGRAESGGGRGRPLESVHYSEQRWKNFS